MGKWSIKLRPKNKRRIKILNGFSASNGAGFISTVPGDEFWADIDDDTKAAFIDVDGGGCITVLPGEYKEIDNEKKDG